MANRVIHFEIHAQDTAKVAEWYKNVFGWEVKKWDNPAMDYWMVMTAPEGAKEQGINGGIGKRVGDAPKESDSINAFECIIDVPNIEEYMEKITAAGGKITSAKMPIPGMAWWAHCKDIEGNAFGIFQEDKNAK